MVSEVGGPFGDESGEDSSEDGGSFGFELPEVNAMPRNDTRFPDYLEDSIFELDGMFESWERYIDSIESGFEQTVSLPGNPYLKRGDALDLLRKQLGQIAERAGEFMREALLFTRATMLHKNGHPSEFVHLFIDMGDGSCGYARFSTAAKTVSYEAGKFASMGELVGKAWFSSLPGELAKQPFYLVTCIVNSVDAVGLASRAGAMADAYMAKMFPDFYSKGLIEVPRFNDLGLELVVEDSHKSGGVTLSLAPAGNKRNAGLAGFGGTYTPA